MIKIRLFTPWCTSEQYLKDFDKIHKIITNSKYGKSFILTSADDYTHAIIINTAMPQLTIPQKNVIGFAHEPLYFLGLSPSFIEYAKKHISKYYIGEKLNLPLPFIEHHVYLSMIPRIDYIPEKKNLMSIMVSHKNTAPGHKYRHKLVQAILKTNLPIDIWGNGTTFYNNLGDSRVKTNFTWDTIGIMYESYKFHVAIENFTTPHYMSEKILNCFIYSTIPIYWGCVNIKQYIDDENLVLLSTDDNIEKRIESDIKLLTEIIKNPNKYYNPININSTKLDKLLNVFDFIEEQFK